MRENVSIALAFGVLAFWVTALVQGFAIGLWPSGPSTWVAVGGTAGALVVAVAIWPWRQP